MSTSGSESERWGWDTATFLIESQKSWEFRLIEIKFYEVRDVKFHPWSLLIPHEATIRVLVHFQDHIFLMISGRFLVISCEESASHPSPLQEECPKFQKADRIQMKDSRRWPSWWCETLSSRGQVSEIRGSSRIYGKHPISPSFLWQIVSKWIILDSNPYDFQRRFNCVHPMFKFRVYMWARVNI